MIKNFKVMGTKEYVNKTNKKIKLKEIFKKYFNNSIIITPEGEKEILLELHNPYLDRFDMRLLNQAATLYMAYIYMAYTGRKIHEDEYSMDDYIVLADTYNNDEEIIMSVLDELKEVIYIEREKKINCNKFKMKLIKSVSKFLAIKEEAEEKGENIYYVLVIHHNPEYNICKIVTFEDMEKEFDFYV